MFRPEKMSFVSISVLDSSLTPVLDRLAKLGVMHVMDKEELPPSMAQLEAIDVSSLRTGFDALNARVTRIYNILAMGNGSESIMTRVDVNKIEIDPFQISQKIGEELLEIEGEIMPVIRQRDQIQKEISDLEENSHQLAVLEAEGVSIEDLQNARFLYFVFGDIPAEYYERLADSLVHVPCVLAQGDLIGDRRQVLGFSLMENKDALYNALDAAYFSKAKIPEKYHGPIIDVLDEIELEIWTKREEIAEIQGKIRSLRERWRDKILQLYATISANQIVTESVQKFGKMERSYFLSGWVPYRDVKKLQGEIEKAVGDTALIVASEAITAEEAGKYEAKIPTKFRHPFFLRPFTSLVTNFGIPGYSDIDPTPLAAIAFLAMFGIMFADVGHGAVLLLLGLIGLLYPMPQLKPIRNMASFLACCGGASLIFGFVFGSIFGKEGIIQPIWFSLDLMESESVNRMLKLGVYFGVGILSVGILLNIAQAFRKKDFKEAFCGQWGIFSLVFYWMAVLMAVMIMQEHKELSWKRILIMMAFLLPILLKEPLFRLFGKKENHDAEEEGESVIESGFQIYEIVMAYLSHTLSYIRMAAFNLSHAGLMMAFYALTEQLGGGDSIFLSLPSNIMANAFVIVLEGLIVTIQCMRLEYYEFFSKFFTGEGIEYRPLKIS